MRRHDEGGQFTAIARGGASAGAQGNTEVEERLDGGGRHDVWAYHGVRQLTLGGARSCGRAPRPVRRGSAFANPPRRAWTISRGCRSPDSLAVLAACSWAALRSRMGSVTKPTRGRVEHAA